MGLLDSTTQNSYYSGSSFGDYQFVTLDHIMGGFMVSYVGESKLINKVSRTDVQFHAMRAIQEFSYDVFRSFKSQEIEVPNTLKMILPQDYVNYTKITTSGSDGIQRNLYPTGKTSNPLAIVQDTDGSYTFSGTGVSSFRQIEITVPSGDSITDGDFIELAFVDSTGADNSLFIIFSTNSSNIDGSNPAANIDNPRFFVDASSSVSAELLATRLSFQINNTGYFTSTSNVSASGKVVVTYKTIPSSFSNEGAKQASDGAAQTRTPISNVTSVVDNLTLQADSDTWTNFKTHTSDYVDSARDDYETDDEIIHQFGRRYGLDPQYAHQNGTFYIDQRTGFIHFGSNLSGKTVVLEYISDGLGTDAEMVVHKFAEEAVYKWIAYGVLSSRSNIPEYIVQRFKKERFAEARKAKIRLSNIKIEEFTQVLKGLSKPIK